MAKVGVLLVKGGLLRVLETVVNMAIAFLMMPFMIRSLGESSYGIWAVAASIVASFHLLDLGFTSAVTRYVSRYIGLQDHDATNRVISTGLVIFGGLALIVLLLSSVLAIFSGYFISVEGDATIIGAVIFLSGLALAIEFPFKAFAGIAYAYLRYDLVVYSRIFFAIVGGAVYYALLSLGYKLIALAVVTLILSVASNITYYLIARYAHKPMRVGRSLITMETARALYNFSIWSFIANIASVIRSGVDNIIIAALMPISAVTHYTIGYRLAEYASQAQLQATNTLTPLFAKYHAKGNTQELGDRIILMTKINTALACFCCLMLFILGDVFIRRWVGEGYEDSYNAMRVLAIGFAISLTYNPLSSAMYATAKLKSQALLELAESLLNFGLSVLLCTRFGIYGVALGTAIPLFVFALVIRPWIACKALEIPLSRHYSAVIPNALLVAVLIGVADILVRPSIPVSYAAVIAIPMVLAPLYFWIVFNSFFTASEIDVLVRQLPGASQKIVNGLLRKSVRSPRQVIS